MNTIAARVMSINSKKTTILEKLIVYGSMALMVYMPFSMFLSRWLSLYTGGLGYWENGKDILTLLLVILSVAYLCLKRHTLYNSKFNKLLAFIALYVLIHILFLIFESQNKRLMIQGDIYNLRPFGYLIIGMTVSLSGSMTFQGVKKIIVICGVMVAVLGLVQLMIPDRNFLENFGYTEDRAARASFAIDDKEDFPRIMSTIREPNSLGAYLLLPLMLLLAHFNKKTHQQTVLILLLTAALFFTFSRSAWIAFILSFFLLKRKELYMIAKPKKNLAIAGVGLIVIAGILFSSGQATYYIQNVLLHSDKSTILDDPNEVRLKMYKVVAQKFAEQPLGYGPGSAGAVSIGSPSGSFITENYYLQILIEVGLLGLVLFLGIFWQIFLLLKNQKKHPYKTTLIALFAGYMVVGLFTHIWSNEAVALQWWFIVGVYIAKKTG